MMRRILIPLMVLALAAMPRPARAHAGLLSADPSPGSTVADSPSQIRLTFDAPLLPGSTFVVYTAAFRAVPGITPVTEGASMRAIPDAPLAPGDYTVQWKAVAPDRDTTAGSYQFRVAPSGGATIPLWGAGLAILAVLGASAVLGWHARRHTPAPAGPGSARL